MTIQQIVETALKTQILTETQQSEINSCLMSGSVTLDELDWVDQLNYALLEGTIKVISSYSYFNTYDSMPVLEDP